MKFRDLTKKVTKGAINLLTGKPVLKPIKSKRKKTPKDNYVKGNNEFVALNVTHIEKTNIGIAGTLTHLPKDLQIILGNAIIKQVKVTGNSSMYVLADGHTVKVTEVRIANRNKQHIIIKTKKKIIIDIYV